MAFFPLLVMVISLINYATINVNGLRNTTTQALLRDFLKTHNIDICFLQEVNTCNLDFLYDYDYEVNLGPENRGTAIVYRHGLSVTSFDWHPSGRIISAIYESSVLINVYVPSGSKYKKEREELWKNGLSPHLAKGKSIIIGGDFNCTINKKDQLGIPNISQTLTLLVTQFSLTDIWEYLHKNDVVFTFRRGTAASRIDRLYTSNDLKQHIKRSRVVPLAFSDHHAVICAIQKEIHFKQKGKGCWKLNASLMLDIEIQERFRQKWQNSMKQYEKASSKLIWWLKQGKPMIRKFFRDESYQVAMDRRSILDFYYITLNELFEQQKEGLNVESKLREIKEKIHNIKTSHLAGAQIRSKTTNLPEIEQTTFYHLAKERRSGTKKTIKSLNTNQGTITGRQEIMQHTYW